MSMSLDLGVLLGSMMDFASASRDIPDDLAQAGLPKSIMLPSTAAPRSRHRHETP